ncbi:hypothetical protein, partial [Nocardia wallacei]|uniref:hypothetical protein n=1 Tax=Nocardia wallacei TaxID=480035 RepID=UPI0024560D87
MKRPRARVAEVLPYPPCAPGKPRKPPPPPGPPPPPRGRGPPVAPPFGLGPDDNPVFPRMHVAASVIVGSALVSAVAEGLDRVRA